MTAPRLEIRLDHIQQNTSTLVTSLGRRGIGVTGVTKATLGAPEVAEAMIRGGVTGLGDSRIENIEALRRSGITTSMTLLRSPMLSQVDRVVAAADISLNTEIAVVAALGAAAAAQGRRHGIVLMVELGDLREGILPADLGTAVACTLATPNVGLRGLGTNLACQNGVTPDDRNMRELTALVQSVEGTFGVELDVVSGGNSATLGWASAASNVGRVDDLRLGEAILLGRDPLDRSPLSGLHTDAFTFVAEVIESNTKPSVATGTFGQTAFGAREAVADRGDRARVLLAVGRQDVDPAGLDPPSGFTILGASSDHLVLECDTFLPGVGEEVRFRLGYGALLAAMTSPYVARTFIPRSSGTSASAAFTGPPRGERDGGPLESGPHVR